MSKIDKEKLIEMKLAGKTDTECAEVLGCNQTAVSAMRRKLEAEGRLTPALAPKPQEYLQEKALQTDDAPATKTVAEYLAEEEVAEAAKRAKDRDVLTKDDGICYKPMAPAPEQTPDPAANAQEAPYPIPPIDRKTFWGMRRDELRGAICEYACYGLRVDPEWVEEYNELVERCEE